MSLKNLYRLETKLCVILSCFIFTVHSLTRIEHDLEFTLRVRCENGNSKRRTREMPRPLSAGGKLLQNLLVSNRNEFPRLRILRRLRSAPRVQDGVNHILGQGSALNFLTARFNRMASDTFMLTSSFCMVRFSDYISPHLPKLHFLLI